MTRGVFVVVEGPDGAGKTTLLEGLKQLFPHAVFTREPGGTPYAEALRQVALHHPEAEGADGLATLLVMYAARRDHLHRLIFPALARGKTVVCDRFSASSWAYNVRGQRCAACAHLFATLEETVVGEAGAPDAYFYLQIDAEEARRRRRAGEENHNHFDERARSFHERVIAGYNEFFANRCGVFREVVVLDAHRTPEELVAQASRELARLIGDA